MLESIILMIKPFFGKFLDPFAKMLSYKVDKSYLPSKHDEKVYERYKEIFPVSTIDFLRNENFSRNFSTEMDGILDAIDSRFFFAPDYTFHNENLKKACDEVIEASFKLHEETRSYIFVQGDGIYGVDKYHRDKLPEINEYSHDLIAKLDVLFLACNKHFDEVL